MDAKNALPELFKYLQEGYEGVREAAYVALESIGTQEGLNAITHFSRRD